MFWLLFLSLQPWLVLVLALPISSATETSRTTAYTCVSVLVISLFLTFLLFILKYLFIQLRRNAANTQATHETTGGFIVGMLGSPRWETRVVAHGTAAECRQSAYMYFLHTESRRHLQESRGASIVDPRNSFSEKSFNYSAPPLPTYPEQAVLDVTPHRPEVSRQRKSLGELPWGRRPTSLSTHHGPPPVVLEKDSIMCLPISEEKLPTNPSPMTTFQATFQTDILIGGTSPLPPLPLGYFSSNRGVTTPLQISRPQPLSANAKHSRRSFSAADINSTSSLEKIAQIANPRFDPSEVQYPEHKFSPPLPFSPPILSVTPRKKKTKAHIARGRRVSPSVGPSPLRAVIYADVNVNDSAENDPRPSSSTSSSGKSLHSDSTKSEKSSKRKARKSHGGSSSADASDPNALLHMIQELVEETSEWDPSLVMDPGFRTMIQESVSSGVGVHAEKAESSTTSAQPRTLPEIPSEEDVTYSSRTKHPSILLVDDGFALTVDQRESAGVAW